VAGKIFQPWRLQETLKPKRKAKAESGKLAAKRRKKQQLSSGFKFSVFSFCISAFRFPLSAFRFLKSGSIRAHLWF
jgi:hypothetical protein